MLNILTRIIIAICHVDRKIVPEIHYSKANKSVACLAGNVERISCHGE